LNAVKHPVQLIIGENLKMANQDDIQKILAEAVTNDDFRSRLIENPVDAVRQAGYSLTDDQVEQLRQLESEKVESMLESVEDRISKAANPAGVVSVGWSE